MTLIQIAILLLSNADKLKDLIHFIGDVLNQAEASNFRALTAEQQDETAAVMANNLAARHAAIAETVRVGPFGFLDLIKLIIDNKDDIVELIQFIRDLIDSFSGSPTSVRGGIGADAGQS